MAGVLNGPDDLLVRVAIFDTKTKAYQNEFRWPALARLGPCDYAGRYAQVTLKFQDVRWSFEMANEGETTYILVRCLDPERAGHLQVHLETLYQLPGGQIVTREEEVIARRPQRAWRVSSPSPTSHRSGSVIQGPFARPFVAVIEPSQDFGRRLELRDTGPRVPAGTDAPLSAAERDIARRITVARQEHLARFGYVPPEFWWIFAAIPYGIGWNIVWAQDRREPLAVCSRDWCVHGNYGEWVLFNWDNFLLIPMAAEYDVDLAHAIVGPQLSLQTPDGLIPGVASPLGISADRGMPPVASYGLWKAYLVSQDRSFVERYYDRLYRYHHWWRRNRDGNRDGLLEWGSNPADPAHPQWQAHTYWASRYETGMDNHPMWDDVPYNPETNTQEQSDIGLNALHALDAICLAYMADLLGRKDEAVRLRDYGYRVGQMIEGALWNEDAGLWLSRGWNGAWNHRASPCCFYPYFLPTTDKGHIQRSIRDHLENPQRFGGKYVMPVSPRDDPAYPEQYYVRGRIWPAQAMLVHSALREHHEEEAAANLARGCIETFRVEWLENGYLRENYHAETARSDDTPESDPLYSFGVMLPNAAWDHLHDVRLDGTEVRADKSVFREYLDEDGALRRQIEPLEGEASLA